MNPKPNTHMPLAPACASGAKWPANRLAIEQCARVPAGNAENMRAKPHAAVAVLGRFTANLSADRPRTVPRPETRSSSSAIV